MILQIHDPLAQPLVFAIRGGLGFFGDDKLRLQSGLRIGKARSIPFQPGDFRRQPLALTPGRFQLRRRFLQLAERVTAGRAIDCGPLASARALEGLTAVIVNVNKRYKAHAGVRLSGLP